MFLHRHFIFGIVLFLPVFSHSQVLDYIDVHLRIFEKTTNEMQALANARVKVSDQGEGLTDAEGQYAFTYAVRNNVDPEISISLFSEKHKVLKPLDGFVALDTSREELFIELLVVNMATESEAFQRRISDLEKRVARLRSKNELTQRQLEEMNRKLVDTILYFEALKQDMEREIAGLEELSEAQRAEINAQKERIVDLEEQVDALTLQLEAALEERYQRQNQYFRDISSNLTGYVRKAKDLRDHMPYINTYFAAGSYDNYTRDIKAYNEIYEKFDDNRLSYLEGVEHYWENKALVRELDQVFDYLAKGIHYSQIYRVTMEIMDELANQRPKKAQKIASMAYEDMALNLNKLEKDINRVLSDLRNNL